MLEKYKAGISLFSLLTMFAVLFPPIFWENSPYFYHTEFAFILSIPEYRGFGGKINFGQLLLEFILIFVIALLFQIYYNEIKRLSKN